MLDLTPIRVMAIYPPVCVEVDLFLPAEGDEIPRLYAAAGERPSARDLDRLLARGITTLHVRHAQAVGLREQMRELAESGVDMAPSVRLEVAREAMKEGFSHAWRSREPDSLIAHAADFSQKVVEICGCGEEMTSALAALAAHDGDTFAHISNVCTYVVMLARALGMTEDDELLRLGQAALLHDLGKRAVRSEILKKPGKLTDAEREVMQDHPRIGFEELCQRPDLSSDQLLMVYQHHEKLDGTGYPVRLCGEEINWMARLCAVVDVFDALTARRCYREATGPQRALEIILKGSGNHFSPEYVQCWTSLVSSAATANV
jgi:HD-GYP domain-containing protein (c-di-GMP phosphodiesterase class II)